MSTRTLPEPLLRDLAPVAGAGRTALLLLPAWALLVGLALLLRPLIPVDETRYATVAWEMWQSGSWLVPQLHGLPYSEKPPLLFWLILAGWQAFGVNEWWPRLVPPLFGLANLFLTGAVARRLWPEQPALAARAPAVLLGMLLWTVYSTLLMFDLLVTFFVLLALLGIIIAWRAWRAWRARTARAAWGGWALTGLALGLGLLAKGPVVLLAPLAVAVLAPWWGRGERPAAGAAGLPDRRGVGWLAWSGWYAGLLAALALAAAVALAWALPAAATGGPRYAEAILLTQTEERIVHSFAHRRPWWWYLPLLPAMLAPFSLWPALWRAAWRRRPAGPGVRFCLAWLVPCFAVLLLVSGKQPHYLLPLLPACALLIAFLMPAAEALRRPGDLAPLLGLLALLGAAIAAAPLLAGHLGLPGWLRDVQPLAGLVLLALLALFANPVLFPRLHQGGNAERRTLAFTLLSVVLVVAAHAGFAEVARRGYDLRPLALYLRGLEDQGRPLVYVGDYHGQFGFQGRLRRPLAEVTAREVDAWLRDHPGGRAVAARRQIPPNRTHFDYVQLYRESFLAVWGNAPGPHTAPAGP